MSILDRLLSTADRQREPLRPLWHAILATSREPEWYAQCRVADSVEGRFDMISVVLALVLLRMEGDRSLADKTALLTELFVADMDRQLRETGVGDLMVGKHIGKLMSVLGGRLGMLRQTLADPADGPLAEGLARNVTLLDGAEAAAGALAARVRALSGQLALQPAEGLLAGRLRG